MDNNVIGKKILRLRKEKGMTQAQLAAEVNVSPQAVSKWENGDAMPDVEMFAILARIFNVSTDYLILDNEGEPCAEDVEELDMDSETTIDVDNDDIEIVIEPEDVKMEPEEQEASPEPEEEPREDVSVPPEDVHAMKRRLATLRTVKWSAPVTPAIIMIMLYGIVLTFMIMNYGWIKSTVGDNGIATISTVVVVGVVLALLLANYVVLRTALKYRIFLRGREEEKYPHNFAGFLGIGTKKVLLWLSRYMIAIKLFYDENKIMKAEIEELNTKIVVNGGEKK